MYLGQQSGLQHMTKNAYVHLFIISESQTYGFKEVIRIDMSAGELDDLCIRFFPRNAHSVIIKIRNAGGDMLESGGNCTTSCG